MDLDERLGRSEQSRRLAWQVLQETRQVLEILGDQRIPRTGHSQCQTECSEIADASAIHSETIWNSGKGG